MDYSEAMLKMELYSEMLRDDQDNSDAARALAELISGLGSRVTDEERALLVMIGGMLRK